MSGSDSSDDIRLLEWTNVVLRHRWLIVMLTLAAGIAAYGLCKSARPMYTAQTTLIANRDAERLSLEHALGIGLARSRSGMLDRFSATLVSSYYMELLQSDTLLRPLADRTWSNGQTFMLMYTLKEEPGLDVERQTLETLRQDIVSVQQDKLTGMLSLQCTTPNPRVSAELANSLVENLTAFLEENRTSGTGELLRMAEARTSETALQLQRSEDALRDFRNHNKMIVSPDLKLREAQLERDIKVHEALFIKLKTEVEVLRISQQQKAEPITVIQPAEIPLWKSWPPTATASVGAAFFGMLFGFGIAFLRHGIGNLAARDPSGFVEFARHIRALNWMLPGIVFLLPSGTRRRRDRLPSGRTREAEG